MNRRKFIGLSSLSIPALQTHDLLFDQKPSPIVISTWDFGKEANMASWEILSKGGSALDAVEAGIRIPEADEKNQTVGYGGLPDRDGYVTLDACIMDQDSNCGAVMGLEHIKHPISVARKVMEKTPHVILVGEGALQFAMKEGFPKENLLTPKSEMDWKEWLKTSKYEPRMNIENELIKKDNNNVPLPGGKENHDTIGLLAMDAKGNISGGCSTSGMAYKMRGRVGDSPVIGAGLYVDNEVGAATSTGVGEEVVRCVGSHLVVELMRQGLSPEAACRKAVERIVKKNPAKSKTIQVGFLAINKKGQYGAFALQKGFTYAVKSATTETIIPGKYYYP
jgi:N4-(beta-N-acetylglucosaminyl)-L-asparaginase